MDHLNIQNTYNFTEPIKNKSFQKFINSSKPSANTSEIKYSEPDNSKSFTPYEDMQQAPSNPPFKESNIVNLNKPKLNAMSIVLSEKNKERRECENVWDNLYNMKNKQELKRIEALTQKVEQENQQILKDCTFTPKIDKSIVVETTKDVFERTILWKHSVESKLAEKKRELELRQLSDCKFSPNIETSKIASSTVINVNGVSNFYKRMKDAKLSNDFKQQRLNKYSGNSWKKQVTISTPYNLSISNAVT